MAAVPAHADAGSLIPDRVRRLLTFVLPAFALAVVTSIIGGTDRGPAGDGPHMLAQGMRLGAWLAEGDLARFAPTFATLSTPHPPVGYLPLAVAGAFTRDVRVLIAFADAVWLLVLLDALVRVVRPAPWWAGQIAWLVGLSASATWWSADHAGFDLVTAATCAQALSWLHATEGFSRTRASLATGAWLALAFLTKYSAPLVLALPVAVVGLGALVRGATRRRNLAGAVLVWGVIFLPWAAVNGGVAWDYVASALVPPDAPGFYPEARTPLQRLGGSGQAEMAAAIVAAYGLPLTLLLTASAAWSRRWVPLLGVVGGIVVLGMMNSREARYALPLVWLLAAAAVPAGRVAWELAVTWVGLAAPTFRGSELAYARCDAACAPARRDMRWSTDLLTSRGTWPQPPSVFAPIDADVTTWRVAEIIEAAARAGVTDRLGLLLEPGGTDQPAEPTVWQLEIEQTRRGWSLETIVARFAGGRLQATSFIGPFPEVPGPPARWVIVVAAGAAVEGTATAARTSVAAAWLAAHPHRVVERWELPDGQAAILAEVP